MPPGTCLLAHAYYNSRHSTQKVETGELKNSGQLMIYSKMLPNGEKKKTEEGEKEKDTPGLQRWFSD